MYSCLENGNCKNEFLDGFNVSSAFPFYDDEFFFPKPKCEMQEVLEGGEKDRKGKKDLAFIGQSYLEEILLASEAKPISKIIEKEKHVWGRKFASEKMLSLAMKKHPEDEDFFIASEDNVMMRVAVPRHVENKNQNSRPYYLERMFFPKAGGLYFFVEILNNKHRITLETALEMLGESGIGTDRNVGNGQFAHEFSTLTLDVPDNPTHQMLLSLCCPNEKEAKVIANSKSTYALVKRGGYISSPAQNDDFMAYRKKSIFMMDEGSILPAGEIRGILHDLKPEIMTEHPIWRDGRAFTLPINPTWND